MKHTLPAQLLSQPWAADPTWLDRFLRDPLGPIDARADPQGRPTAAENTTTVAPSKGVAVVRMSGPVLSGVPSWYADYMQFVDPAALAAQLRSLALNADVTAVVVDANSPGGSVVGVTDAAAAMRELAAIKPVYVVANDMLASAAYWIAAGATAIYASRTAVVGSIGVIAAWVDQSKAIADQGVEYHYYRSGEEKAPGGIGEAMSSQLDAALLHLVSATAEVFYSDVALGRSLTPTAVVERFGTGRVWVGQHGADSGIVDDVVDLQQTIARALAASPQPAGRPAAQARPMRAASTDGGHNMTAEQLAALGLSADATPEQIQAALAALNLRAQAGDSLQARDTAIAAALALAEGEAAPADPVAALAAQAADGRAYRSAQLDRLEALTITVEGNDERGRQAAADAREVYAGQPIEKICAQVARLESRRDELPAGPLSRHGETAATSRPNLAAFGLSNRRR